MSETTLTSPSTIAALQSMIHELYALRELVTNAAFSGNVAYAGSNPLLDLSKVVGTANGIGYVTGSGGTVTQATSKGTAVTLNKASGNITLNAASLASGATARFQFSNSVIGAADIILLQLTGLVAATSSYNIWIDGVGSGVCFVCVKNISGGALAESIVLGFAVIKVATA